MEVQPQHHVRPPRTRANRPEVITSRGRIIGYHKSLKGIREISRLLGISRDTVRLWVRRYKEEGHALTRARPGKPRVTTPAAYQQIQRAAERAPLSTAVRITRETGIQCHPITTRRRIRDTGRHCFIPARKETLTDAHREARKWFAEAYAVVGVDFCRSVIFTDEKCLSSVAAVGHQCWLLRNTKYARRHIHETSTSGRVTTSMHGWMWWVGVGELTDIEGRMNADQYINILEQ
ncbi:putative helix-turn-helix domain containing protein 3 [Homarus americanus]|uniref:Putative helix-turn-helix domain containing protein 3 n=1 Tax=Homarus americanus TaxID=6706 RepID=A0A8J5K1W8_HOMAM|nr:putative helix-turn-helix domain containing protein 3 [Homarus americanus]